MSKTLQQMIDAARVILQDTDTVRYPDEDLVQYANDCMSTMYRLRPDFALASPLVSRSTADLSTPLPDFLFEAGYEPAMVDFIVHRAQMRDDQYHDEGISVMMLEKFLSQMLGLGA